MRVKEEIEKAGLKLNLQKTKIMAASPITSWQIDWEKVETVTDFLFLGSKITADGDCSHAIKRCLLLVRKAMMHIDSILKSRDITLLTKVHRSQSYIFSSSHVQMWELDHKKVECQRIDTFELWCWRRLKNPLDSKEIKPVNPRENQPWIFIGRTDAEAPILWPPDAKGWPQCYGRLSKRKRWQKRMRRLESISNSVDKSLSKPWETVKDREAWHAAVHRGVAKNWTWLGDWTTSG